MTIAKRSDAPPVALSDGYYYENGCTVASNVRLTERNYGTRRTFFFVCDPTAVQAILPDGWILRDTAEPKFHLMVHFNDWLHTSRADNTPHAVQAPPYVGFLVPVHNSFLKRSGIMQVYGFAAGSHYTGGPWLIVDLLIRTLRGLTRTALMFYLHTINIKSVHSTPQVFS